MKNRDYSDYIQDLVKSINEVQDFIKDMDFEEFSKDVKTINAVIRSVEVLGEASKKIPKTLKEKYLAIPWSKMAGMRDKLIHEYFGIDLEILWEVVRKDLLSIKPFILKMSKDNI